MEVKNMIEKVEYYKFNEDKFEILFQDNGAINIKAKDLYGEHLNTSLSLLESIIEKVKKHLTKVKK